MPCRSCLYTIPSACMMTLGCMYSARADLMSQSLLPASSAQSVLKRLAMSQRRFLSDSGITVNDARPPGVAMVISYASNFSEISSRLLQTFRDDKVACACVPPVRRCCILVPCSEQDGLVRPTCVAVISAFGAHSTAQAWPVMDGVLIASPGTVHSQHGGGA